MTVQELIDELQSMDADAEVRFAAQPSWPFEYEISSVLAFDEADDRRTIVDPDEGTWSVLEDGPDEPEEIQSGFDSEEAAERWIEENSATPVVYLYEGAQLGYLPGAARKGWS